MHHVFSSRALILIPPKRYARLSKAVSICLRPDDDLMLELGEAGNEVHFGHAGYV